MLNFTPKRFYNRMTTEEYMINTREAFLQTSHQATVLKPLQQANHLDANIRLYSMPVMPMPEQQNDFLVGECQKHRPDLMFLQFDPMPYITRQRFMS